MDDHLRGKRPADAIKRLVAAIGLLLALWACPTAAWALPTRVSLTQYQGRLATIVQHMEAAIAAGVPSARAEQQLVTARELADVDLLVQVPAGEVPADLQPILIRLAAGKTDQVREAVVIAKEQLRAAERLAQPAQHDLEKAHRDLQRILDEQSAELSWTTRFNQWLSGWLYRLRQGGERVLGARITAWAATLIGVAGLALVVRSLVRTLGGTGSGTDIHAFDAAGLKERIMSPDDLWREARSLSAGGDHVAALRTGYLALLRHFDRLSLVRYVPALTNREHERHLRSSHPALAQQLSPLTGMLERLLYAGEAATADDFARGAGLIELLWREGEAASRRNQGAITGASSSAPSS